MQSGVLTTSVIGSMLLSPSSDRRQSRRATIDLVENARLAGPTSHH